MIPDGYEVQVLADDHASALAAAYDRNREHLAPWDPVRPPAFFTPAGQAADVVARLDVVRRGLGASWVLLRGGEVVGRVNLNNIVRGVFQSGSVGYWVDRDHVGRGLATALVGHAAERADELGLHRLEAGTLTHNLASQAVLRHSGFEEFGRAPSYLFIAGQWRDHVLFQRLLHDGPPGNLVD
ncbi:GNAT family N-acetyltransferase [Nocardioides sp. W7]|uniref:GNAT family N-acetyltransferase n=1 Tax=Nocardioides sp. W7 TaxID=2931390 RepID=UPI001FD4ADFB|nr:GNAT family N-acetyltransferase [Nocardioides sp. W7]